MQSLSQFDFHHRLQETSGLALVCFSSPGCSSCRHLKGELESLQSLAPAIDQFEVDVQRDPALAREFELFHLPSLFLYVNGEYHRPIQAEAKAEKLLAAIFQAVAEPAEEAP